MEGPPLGPGGEDITWPDQVAPRGRKASSTRKIKPQTSNLTKNRACTWPFRERSTLQHSRIVLINSGIRNNYNYSVQKAFYTINP